MATTYYVQASGGSDSNSGTETNPFKTIQHAVNLVAAGDTVIVRAGTYVETVTIRNSGTATAPISIIAYPGEQPVIDGRAGVDGLNSGLPSIGALYGTSSRDGTGFRYEPLVSIEASYILFDGIDITRSMGRGLRAWNNGNEIIGLTIRNCDISYSREAGLLLELICRDTVIEDCSVSRSSNFAPYRRDPNLLDWSTGLTLKGSQNTQIRRCRVFENWGEGIIADALVSGAKDVIISQCEVYDNLAPSIYLHGVENVLVERNLLYHTRGEFPITVGAGGIVLTPSEPQFTNNYSTQNVLVVNNLISGFDHNIGIWDSPGRMLKSIRIYFNTLVNGESFGISETNTSAPYEACEFKNNIIYQSNGQPLVNNGSLFSGWAFSNNAWSTTPPNYVRSSSDVIGDPKLANPNATPLPGNTNPEWYMLTEGSPAIGKALSIQDVLEDFFGKSRDDLPDIGGHEFAVETISAKFSATPLTGLAPLKVTFKDESTASQPITSWFWDFGDGSISTDKNPQHEYKQGTFSVSLRVSTGTIYDINTKQNFISVQAPEVNSPPRVTDGLAVLYRFDEGRGENIYDVSGVGKPLDLRITEPTKTSWLKPGLKISSSTAVVSNGPAEKINEACRKTNQISLEVWIKPGNISQKGPARIVSISQNAYSRNTTLGQGLWGTLPSDLFDVRLRTTERSANGMPSLSSPAGSLDLTLRHIVFTRDAAGNARIYIDGTIITEAIIPGDYSTWNPRFPLLIGNETTMDYPWLGEIYLMAIYSRALTSSEVIENRDAGIPVQQLLDLTPVSIEIFKRFVIISNGNTFTTTKTLAFGVQYPDERCVVCTNNGSNGMTIYEDVRKAAAEYAPQKAVVKWLD